MWNSDKNQCLEYPGFLWGKPDCEFTDYFNKSILYAQTVADCEECLKHFSWRGTDLPEFKCKIKNTL